MQAERLPCDICDKKQPQEGLLLSVLRAPCFLTEKAGKRARGEEEVRATKILALIDPSA
jgi:hypothetical protein